MLAARCATFMMTGSAIVGCGVAASTARAAVIPSKQITYAREQITKGEAEPKFSLKAPAFSVAGLKGKTVLTIPTSSSIQFCTDIDSTMATIGQKYGVKVSTFANQGDPSQYAQGVTQAISQQDNAIVLQCGVDPSLIAPELASAKEKGIVSIDTNLDDPVVPTPKSLSAETSGPTYASFAALADELIAHSGGKPVHALFVTSYDIPPARGEVMAFKRELKKHCASACSVTYVNVPAADWSTKIQTTITSELAANKSINALVPMYDAMIPYAAPADQASHRNLKMYTYGGAAQIEQLIKSNKLLVCDIGLSTGWLAYSGMDQVFRLLAGKPEINNELGSGFRIFDSSNVGQAFRPDAGFGTAYVSGYEKLWKTK
jgi:ribose transport system substrate-binding protein